MRSQLFWIHIKSLLTLQNFISTTRSINICNYWWCLFAKSGWLLLFFFEEKKIIH
ncbi:hypothetical protein DCAR_0101982 [Daucus carota subsp. sativus]|uniref:Uncharacterized protein n=1 Tax=Daucus carota subsp. sativus TaxID=79200 RepID=A0AAF1AG47_DAUCS|nr:hypothetical protein DCAR_0101982 [Daucus carota subsp. sativus]